MNNNAIAIARAAYEQWRKEYTRDYDRWPAWEHLRMQDQTHWMAIVEATMKEIMSTAGFYMR